MSVTTRSVTTSQYKVLTKEEQKVVNAVQALIHNHYFAPLTGLPKIILATPCSEIDSKTAASNFSFVYLKALPCTSIFYRTYGKLSMCYTRCN